MAAVAAMLLLAAACSSSGGSGTSAGGNGGGSAPANTNAGSAPASSAPEAPKDVQFIVDTGPGGGSDLFAREIIKLAQQDKLISDNWPVLSEPQGGGLGAMSFLKGKKSDANFISAFTSKWIIAGLGTPNAPATLADLTPIAELVDETQVIAAPANAPYDTMAGFIAAAKAKPGKLVQTGGSVSSVDNLVALQIEKQSGTKWKYLSFSDGGPRITALLRGDAQIDIGGESDFTDQIKAGKLKLIGVFGDKRLAAYPNVPTIAEQGIDLGGMPDQLQFRGIAGPPDMPASAVAYYQDLFKKLSATPEWTKYLTSAGLHPAYATGDDLTKLLSDFTTAVTPIVPKSG